MRTMQWMTLAAAAAVVSVVASGCGSAGEGGSCASTVSASCSGTFECGNSGLRGACDRATQVCVVAPGSVRCVTVPGASSENCPSKQAALAVAGCNLPEPTCTGSSGTGIVIEC